MVVLVLGYALKVMGSNPGYLLKSFQLYLFLFLAPPRRTTLAIGWVSPQLLNITCEAQSAYPEPVIRILINSQSSSSVATKNER